MKKFFFISTGIIISLASYSQENSKSFGTKNPGQSKVLVPNKQGALIFGEHSKNDKKELLIYQTNNQNELMWSKSISAKDPLVINDALATRNGGYVLAAENYINNRESLLLINLDENGEENWVSTFNEEGNEVEPYAIEASPTAYYIGGFTKLKTLTVNSYYNFSVEKQFPYLLKTSLDGKKIWAKQIQLSNKNVVGDIRDISITKDNQLLFIANIYNPTSKTKSLTNYLVKMNEEGDVIWSKSIVNKGLEFFKLIQDQNQNIYLVGKKTITEKKTNTSLMKLTAKGEIIWSKNIGNSGIDIPIDLTLHENKIYLSLSTTSFDEKNRSQSLVLSFDNEGNMLYNTYVKHMDFSKIASLKSFNGELYFCGSIIQITDRILMNSISGTFNLNSNNQNYKLFSKKDEVEFKLTPIELIDVIKEVSSNSIENKYKITISDEKISSKKL